MNARYDLVIRHGLLADGTGAALVEADVAVSDGRSAAVGRFAGAGREEIDAKGLLVTPGFVDIHTHYDGQATWDRRMQPSPWHGVTTVVMGNCGVGFAPCRPEDHDGLIPAVPQLRVRLPGSVLRDAHAPRHRAGTVRWRRARWHDLRRQLSNVQHHALDS